MTAVIKCSCQHTYQDKVYGVGMRVHSPLQKKSVQESQRYRCTVCSTVRDATETAKK